MDSSSAASLINIIGFTVGIALYTLLGVMIARTASGSVRVLLGATAVLGLLWNAGELGVIVYEDLNRTASPLWIAAAYSALGFLPSVVVHSAVASKRFRGWPIGFAYLLSSAATCLHFYSAAAWGAAPSANALRLLTVGAVVLAAVLLILNYRETLERKAVWGTALLIFAAGALHLSDPGDERSWAVELLAHQSSLPIALVILYQNYRFAFADLFLKRAVSVILLAAAAFTLYTFVAVPVIRLHEGHDPSDVQAVGVMIALWMATALVYPAIYRFAVRFVDRIVLDRSDYQRLRAEIAREIDDLGSADDVLTVLTREIGRALTAGERKIGVGDLLDAPDSVTVSVDRDSASVQIPTHEAPYYTIGLGKFEGGRRLLSDETAVLNSIALHAARKIDGLRVNEERYRRELRENEISKFAAQAQLTALRAQINPHFLFNALTTIGYLIQTSPDKAFQTLLHLTKLLRSVLSSTAEFTTLRDELDLVRNYLDIERARFEEKLAVEIDVEKEAELLSLPSLILQPLVENAIKHAVAEDRNGGKVLIKARIDRGKEKTFLVISVEDTGRGDAAAPIASGEPSPGVGIGNIRDRLLRHYGRSARLDVNIDTASGSRSTVTLPLEHENEQRGKIDKGDAGSRRTVRAKG